MTQAPGAPVETESRGILGSARRVVAHASALARLQRELARDELQRKGAKIGAAAAASVAAAVLALFAIGFAFAAIAAALALAVAWWLALLIVFTALVVLVVVLAFVARNLIRAATPLKPEKALAEVELTRDALRSTRAE